MMNSMVIVVENGLPTCLTFMQEIRKRDLEGRLAGWWWSSDKGLINDPSESDEIVVKAQTIYDALTGKPVYVNGVRMFNSHTPHEIHQMLDVKKVDLLSPPKELP